MRNIITDDTVANSPAFPFVLREYSKLVDRGHADLEMAFENTYKVTYVIDGAQVLAASVWMLNPKRAVWVLFSAVAETHRRQGLYSQLMTEVEREGKLLGAVALYSGVHVDNAAMLEASVKQGRKPVWYRTRKDLYSTS